MHAFMYLKSNVYYITYTLIEDLIQWGILSLNWKIKSDYLIGYKNKLLYNQMNT